MVVNTGGQYLKYNLVTLWLCPLHSTHTNKHLAFSFNSNSSNQTTESPEPHHGLWLSRQGKANQGGKGKRRQDAP